RLDRRLRLERDADRVVRGQRLAEHAIEHAAIAGSRDHRRGRRRRRRGSWGGSRRLHRSGGGRGGGRGRRGRGGGLRLAGTRGGWRWIPFPLTTATWRVLLSAAPKIWWLELPGLSRQPKIVGQES